MINSVYRNAMKNLRKIINVRLVNNAKDYKKYVSKPNFISQKKINKNFVAIHEIKLVLTLDKLIYVGFSVLGLRKYSMYYFYYNYVKRKYNAKIIFADIDSQFIKLKQIMVMKVNISDEFFRLKSKNIDRKESKTGKGVYKDVVKNKAWRIYWRFV